MARQSQIHTDINTDIRQYMYQEIHIYTETQNHRGGSNMLLRRPWSGHIAQHCGCDCHHNLKSTEAPSYSMPKHACAQQRRAKSVLKVPLGIHDSALGFACSTPGEQVIVLDKVLHM